jgi:hypothetical protein
MVTVSDVLGLSAALLNDNARAVYTNAVQLPYFNMALAELQEEMQRNGIAFNNAVAEVEVPTGVLSIGGPGGPTLPTNLVEPINLYERDTDATNEDWADMVQKEFLPTYTVQTQSLIYWAWQQQQIKFLGATSDRTIKIEYISDGMAVVTDVDQNIPIIEAKSFLQYRTAALCAEFIMENPERAAALNGNCVLRLDTSLAIKIRTKQSIAVRRRPFRLSRKVRGSGW